MQAGIDGGDRSISNHLAGEVAEQAHVLNNGHYRSKLTNGITLHALPRVTVTWDEFVEHAPPYSLAVDGMVYGRPRFSAAGPHANFNHHEEVDRLSTRSTCAQLMVAIKQGLLESFKVNGGVRMEIFANDPDQDVSLSVWLIKNHERFEGHRGEPLINRLLWAEDLLDTTAGAYPLNPNSDFIRQINWIFDPYSQARLEGRIFSMQGAELANVIAAVGERITRYSLGSAEELELDLRYNTIGGGDGWSMIEEVGSAARTGLLNSGVSAYVSVKQNEDGSYKYTLGKMSPFVPFPIEDLYQILNTAEEIPSDAQDRWGGGDIVGGSPRKAGSQLEPAQVEDYINRYLNTL